MSDWNEIKRPFRDALIAAFDWQGLVNVLEYHCQPRKLRDITSRNVGFETNVDEVIVDAVKKGWLEKLAQGALAENKTHTGLNVTVPHILAGVVAEGNAFYQGETDVPHVEKTEQVSNLNKRKSSPRFIAAGVVLIIILGLLLLYASQEVNLPVFQNNVFTYVVRVKDKNTDQNIPYANVIVEVPGQLPLDSITDVNGIVSIPIPARYAKKPGRILVEKQGYDPYRQEINLQRDSLPDTIQLQGTSTIAPTNTSKPKPIITSTSIRLPSSTPTSDDTIAQTATLTLTLPPALTPTATQTNVPISRISDNAAVFRAGPGINHQLLGYLERGDEVTIIGRNETASWLNVIREEEDTPVWIPGSAVDLPETAEDIPVAATIPTPPHTPTPTPSVTNTPAPTSGNGRGGSGPPPSSTPRF